MDHNWGGGLNAPTVALALKWMRDVKGVRYSIEPSNDDDDLWLADLYDADGFSATVGGNGAKYPSYEQVESALLDESLSLIEKKN